jgi:hypothetical protein
MFAHTAENTVLKNVALSPEILEYIEKHDCDFRICTSCGGPILLPTRIKPPKRSDFILKAGSHVIYVSIHQARYLHSIGLDMIPFSEETLFVRQERR